MTDYAFFLCTFNCLLNCLKSLNSIEYSNPSFFCFVVLHLIRASHYFWFCAQGCKTSQKHIWMWHANAVWFLFYALRSPGRTRAAINSTDTVSHLDRWPERPFPVKSPAERAKIGLQIWFITLQRVCALLSDFMLTQSISRDTFSTLCLLLSRANERRLMQTCPYTCSKH